MPCAVFVVALQSDCFRAFEASANGIGTLPGCGGWRSMATFLPNALASNSIKWLSFTVCDSPRLKISEPNAAACYASDQNPVEIRRLRATLAAFLDRGFLRQPASSVENHRHLLAELVVPEVALFERFSISLLGAQDQLSGRTH